MATGSDGNPNQKSDVSARPLAIVLLQNIATVDDVDQRRNETN
jgi:hypothetical protein